LGYVWPATRVGRVAGFSFRRQLFPQNSFVQTDSDYQLVRLNNGICSVRSLADAETFHPVVGPVAEAEALYVNQLKLRERLQNHTGEFVIWDVGLGAAANSLTVLRATRDLTCQIRLVSFDHTIEPLKFALQHAADLGYFGGYEKHLQEFLRAHQVTFQDGLQAVNWEFHHGDFPAWLESGAGVPPAQRARQREQSAAALSLGADRRDACPTLPAPHVILFDAYSPARNPAMWTLPLFTNLFQQLDPQRPCAMPTYSRSTILRVTLLLAGFFVGVGHATGEKEETTIAANDLSLIAEPLHARWLARARRSHSAEPMMEPVYRIAPLSETSWQKLAAHPQFAGG
jgi:tRNA U34 5-methylaminomethyl-2-thiouridine-forming methyltransferase MnmC